MLAPHSSRNVWLAFTWFAAAMAVLLSFLLFWGHLTHGIMGAQVATAAWGLVASGALAALVASAVSMHGPHAASANLFGVLPRMAVPLIGLMGLGSFWPSWNAANGPGMLMGCYLITLTIEVLLTIQFLVVAKPGQVKPANHNSTAPSTTAMGA
jgi:hypothetical protein